MTAIAFDRRDTAPLLLLAAALAALGGAYGSQYLGGLHPCNLCLYQRWPWWIAGGLTLLAFLAPAGGSLRSKAMVLAGLTLLVGAGIASYHVGVEQHWWPGPATCSGGFAMPQTLADLQREMTKAVNVPCDQPAWTLGGISMAGFNAAASLAAGLFGLLAARGRS